MAIPGVSTTANQGVSAPPPPPPPPPPAPKPAPTRAESAPADGYTAAKVAPTPLHTPEQTRIAAQYKDAALKDVADPRTLKVLNDELKAKDPNAKPITPEEAKAIIKNTDVRVLSADDYKAVKQALGGLTSNPAAACDKSLREKLATEGVEKLALARARERTGLRDTQPTQADLDQARADLRRIDPGAFQTPVKDAVYVNESRANKPVSDPTKTKVADHEFVHIVLNHRGATAGEGPQHRIIGKLGWNQAEPGENSNWGTPPGQGLPPR